MGKSFPRNSWNDREVEAHWDAVSSVYVQENDRVKVAHDQRFRESVDNLRLEKGLTLLNISSRDGEAVDFIKLESPDCEVYNAEISSGLMRVASEIRPEIRQEKIDTFSSLPFEDGKFDRVLSLETLEHASDPLAFLKELHRVSTEKAILVLSCPPASSEIPYRIYSFLFGGHGEGPHRFPPSRRVKKMFSLTGWNLLLHKGTVLFPVGPVRFQQWGEHLINRLQKTFISELGIRQFYVCNKQ